MHACLGLPAQHNNTWEDKGMKEIRSPGLSPERKLSLGFAKMGNIAWSSGILMVFLDESH